MPYNYYEMDDEKFQKLMDEIQKSWHEVETKLSSSLVELKQERVSQELAQRITKSSHQFQ